MSQNKNPKIAWCTRKHCYLTKNQVKLHHCLDLPHTRSPCKRLLKLNCPYWEEKERINKEKKERKRKLYADSEE